MARIKQYGLLLLMLISLGLTGCTQEKAVYQPAIAKLIDRASVYKNANQVDKAICRLESAEDIAPNEYPVQYNLGVIYSENNRYPEAIIHLEKAVSISPNQANGWYTLAYSYEALGDEYTGAVSPAAPPSPEGQVVTPMPKSPEKAKENYQKALKAYQKFLKLASPDDPGREEAQNQITYLTKKLLSSS